MIQIGLNESSNIATSPAMKTKITFKGNQQSKLASQPIKDSFISKNNNVNAKPKSIKASIVSFGLNLGNKIADAFPNAGKSAQRAANMFGDQPRLQKQILQRGVQNNLDDSIRRGLRTSVVQNETPNYFSKIKLG